eukprot:317930-Pyramimonas_sp.AAC.1
MAIATPPRHLRPHVVVCATDGERVRAGAAGAERGARGGGGPAAGGAPAGALAAEREQALPGGARGGRAKDRAQDDPALLAGPGAAPRRKY